MGFDQPTHWLVIAIVAGILFFGWKNLPDMARSAGKSLRIFKTEMKGMADDDDKRTEAKRAVEAPPEKPSATETATSSVEAPADPPTPRAN